MRTAPEIRQQCLRVLHYSLTRPGMYGVGASLENLYRHQLDALLFIDERPAGLAQQSLHKAGLWTAVGAYGALEKMLAQRLGEDLEAQLAACYAEVAAELGYFEKRAKLDPVRWAQFTDWVSVLEPGGELTEGQLTERWGEPAFATLGSGKAVVAYSSSDPLPWIHFDCDEARRVVCVRKGNKMIQWLA